MDYTLSGDLILDSLRTGIPSLTKIKADMLKEACIWCLTHCQHENGVKITCVVCNNDECYSIKWKSDVDTDGIGNACDSCIAIANADQHDSNGDGFGNRCDADFNNDGIVNALDLVGKFISPETVNGQQCEPDHFGRVKFLNQFFQSVIGQGLDLLIMYLRNHIFVFP